MNYCEVTPCKVCGKIPKVGGSKIVHPLCDCFEDKYFDFDTWQSITESDEIFLRAQVKHLRSNIFNQGWSVDE